MVGTVFLGTGNPSLTRQVLDSPGRDGTGRGGAISLTTPLLCHPGRKARWCGECGVLQACAQRALVVCELPWTPNTSPWTREEEAEGKK